uniref:Peroxisomal membrane protein PEX16 n=1 Tax=Tetraselmis sp. GSL018 TaxID=582737 RepID=A0A061RB81_9CHLO
MTTYSVTCSDCLSSPPALDLSKVVQWVVSRIPCAGQATRWPFLVSAVQQVEVLFEMGAEQWCSSSRRWSKYDFLFALELLKFSLRVATLHSHGGRILVDGACTKDGYCAGSRAEARRSESARLEESLAAFARFREAMVPEEAAEGGEEPDAGTDSRSGARASSAGANGVGALLCEGPPEEGGAALYWWNAPDAPSSQHLSGAPPTSEQHGGSAAATGFCSQQAVWRRISRPVWSRRAATELLVLGEVMHLARPMVYCWLLRRYGVRSWRPWLISLLIDAASARLLSLGNCLSNPRPSSVYKERFTSLQYSRSLSAISWSSVEVKERQRRKLALILYLIRSPCFESATKPVLYNLNGFAGRVPLIGFVTEKALEILIGVQRYFTYTSAS